MYYTAKFRMHPPAGALPACTRRSPQVPGHPVWVSRGGQERILPHTMEQLGDVVPMFRSWAFLWCFVGIGWWRCSVEQVIAAPKISLDRVPQRSAARCPQKAEQLVEVQTERGYVFALIATKALGRRRAAALAEPARCHSSSSGSAGR